MTPAQLRKAQEKLGLTLGQLALMLGYQGGDAGAMRALGYSLTTGRREIREPQRRLVQAYLDGYRPDDWPVEG